MKVRELIEQLQKCDPELDVCIIQSEAWSHYLNLVSGANLIEKGKRIYPSISVMEENSGCLDKEGKAIKDFIHIDC